MHRLSDKPAFWVFVLLAIGCSLVVVGEHLRYVDASPGAYLLSLILLAVTAVPAGLLIYRFDQFEPEPASLVAVALVWGTLVATTLAGDANSWLMGSLADHVSPEVFDRWAAALVAPVTEEFFKGAGLVAIFLMARREIDGLMDGLVYGAMIGLGFQVIENVQYFLHFAGEGDGSGLGTVVGMYFLRVLLVGLYSHTLFTGLMGFGFAYAVTRLHVPRWRRMMVAGFFAFLAWAAHFIWNAPWLDSLLQQGWGWFVLAVAFKGMPFVIFLVILAVFARKREREAFGGLIASEVGTDVLSEGELRVLISARRRRRAVRTLRRNRGRAAGDLLKRLHREQMNLAVLHKRTQHVDHPALEAQREKVRALRVRLTMLR